MDSLNIIHFVAVSILGAALTILNAYIRQFAQRRKALIELRRNPYCYVGAVLHEYMDVAGRRLMGDCTITDVSLGNVTLQGMDSETSEPRYLLQTCEEYRRGYAVYKTGPKSSDALPQPWRPSNLDRPPPKPPKDGSVFP